MKLILLFNFAIAVLFIFLVPVFCGVSYLDSVSSGIVLERFVSLSGVILMIPMFFPEQDKNITELVESKYRPMLNIYAIRLVLSVLFMSILILGFTAFMYGNECAFDFGKFFAGAFATAFFLGASGFATFAVTDNIIAGYLVPLCWFILNMVAGKNIKYLKLFSLSENGFNEKYILLISGMVLILASFLARYIYMRKR